MPRVVRSGRRRVENRPKPSEAPDEAPDGRKHSPVAPDAVSSSIGASGSGRGLRRNGTARAVVSKPVDPDRKGRQATTSSPGGFVDALALDSDDMLLRQSAARTAPGAESNVTVLARPKILDFTARLRERRMAGIRVTMRHVLAAILALALIGGMAWGLLLSPMLRLERDQIMVEGANQWVPVSQITGIVDDQVNRSLLLVPTSHLEQEIGMLPGVTEVTIGRRFPHGLRVSITAQRPASLLKTPDGKLTAVDRNARVLNAVGASVSGIPVIAVSSVSGGLANRAVKQALTLLSSLPEPMRHSITVVSAKTQDSVTTVLGHRHVTIIWGDASDVKLKLAVADTLMNDSTAMRGKQTVDVSAPLRPIIR